jgi:membrane-bound serine protease (ClpP class)
MRSQSKLTTERDDFTMTATRPESWFISSFLGYSQAVPWRLKNVALASCFSKFMGLCALLTFFAPAFSQEKIVKEPRIGDPSTVFQGMEIDELEAKRAFRLMIPFPLTDREEARIKQQIQRIVDQGGQKDRSIVVLQFESTAGEIAQTVDENKPVGRGTEFERSLALARWLIGPTGIRARTVAYLPQSIEGNAVLIALACEEIAMAPLVEIGRASIDDNVVDPLVIESFVGIAKRRGFFPEAAVRSMLDREASLYRVELTDEKSLFVGAKELEKLQQGDSLLSETQLSVPNQLGNFVGQELRKWQWISYVVRDEAHLRESLGVQEWKSLKRQTSDGPVHPVVIEIRSAVGTVTVNRWLRVLNDAIAKEQANLIIFHIHSAGGSLDESLRLANQIADVDDEKIQTVAWVDGVARGDAALIALAADTLFATPNAILGGPGEATIDEIVIRDRFDDWKSLARKVDRTQGEIYALLSPKLAIHEFTNARGAIEIGDDELFARRADFKDWKKGKAVLLDKGIQAEDAKERRWVTDVIPNLVAVGKEFAVDKLPEPKRVTPLEQWVRNLADQEWLATLLLTLSLALFTNELTTPGLGIAGFLSMVCMLLFFWMRFLNGTVEWLEILLFLGGLFCLGLELFVLPGFGIFGFGGFIMLIAGIILASQTFIVPTNDYQWSKLAINTSQVAVALVGFLGTLYLLRNQLEHLPFVRLLKLDPPAKQEQSKTTGYEFLLGKRGLVTGRCSPIGTAMIDDQFYEVQAADALLEPNTPIEVYEVRGKTIFVRAF